MVTKNLTRRQFMATVTAGAGTVLLGNEINAYNQVNVKKNVDLLKKVPWAEREYKPLFWEWGQDIMDITGLPALPGRG